MFRVSFAIIAIYLIPLFSFAQTVSETSTVVEFQPAFPKPGQAVEVSLLSVPSTLSGASIVWSIGEQVFSDAENQRSFSIEAPPLGETLVVSASLQPSDRNPLIISNTLRSSYLDIIFEPQTRVPDFYRGRAAPSPGSTVNVTALYNGTVIDSDDLQFTWRRGRDVLNNGGSRGAQKISFTVPRFSTGETISVEVADASGVILGRQAVFLPVVEPFLHFYQFDPLTGLKTTPLIDNTLVLTTNSGSVQAEPYHLAIQTYNNPDIAEWKVAGIPSAASPNPYQITLQQQTGAGNLPIEFQVQSTVDFSQGAQGDFRLSF